ncbi:unnamed protein product [Cuscuta campestris]|uniref:Uncharacterized protein n=1 Tax=Cuscuta campestris TaxID=132261 RepID=A0A484KXW7_9ASTE|nr:unnamed protein product [Cuscuta campestris]
MADEKVEKTEKPVSQVIGEEEEIGEKQVTKISPYELRSADTPALVITQIKLTGDKNCGQNGHEISGCFQIIGYPEWWGDRPRPQATAYGRGRGGGGAGRGRGRQTRGGGGGRGNRYGRTDGGGPSAHTARTDGNGERERFSKEQWNALMGIFKEKELPLDNKFSGIPVTSWIIDSGASQHMTGDIKNLKDVEWITACSQSDTMTESLELVEDDEFTSLPICSTPASRPSFGSPTGAIEKHTLDDDETTNSETNQPDNPTGGGVSLSDNAFADIVPAGSPTGSSVPPDCLRRGTRERKPSTRLRDFVVHTIQHPQAASPSPDPPSGFGFLAYK